MAALSIADRRLAGVVVPLFSFRTASDWGVGELTALAEAAPMLERGGFSVLMTLPLLEPSLGQESPYSPLSAFAIDPLYVSLDACEELVALGGRAALAARDVKAIERARASFAVRHDIVRPLKMRWLARCAEHFETSASAERKAGFERFRTEHAHWLADYALFRALKDRHPAGWREWPEPLARFDAEAIASARVEHAARIRALEYIQFVAFGQLAASHEALTARGIALGGDEPFLCAADSADVWSRQDLYRFDATAGAPPDAFSATGQNWGLPPYDWDRVAAEDYRLFGARARHAARHFDLTRIDHVVGLYRTFQWPLDGRPGEFVPAQQDAQLAQGEAVLRTFMSGGLALIAEDLGVIPDFVRESLDRLAIPGFRVLRWEERDGRFRVPSEWPVVSVATNGTHDTETSAVWWETLDSYTKDKLRAVPELGELDRETSSAYGEHVHDALLRAIYGAPSRLAIVVAQDVFGLRARINVPSTVGPHNWSWRLPWSLESMLEEDHVRGRLDEVRALAERTGRRGG
ncbi:MAG: 4-alpha-glucanotransferase [Sandaracinaceae bacterium]